ncbi:peptidylprolyl isomerase [Candidatus Babeliales bacterium]|nr:peptidylprolyl isomerase [Candidatus Babeliales bacterium]
MVGMREDIKRFKSVLFIVLIGMLAAYASSIFYYDRTTPRGIKVAMVDKTPVYLNEYQSKLMDVKLQIERLKFYAKMQGFSPEMFLALTGLNDPSKVAFRDLISDKLLDKVTSQLDIYLDNSYFTEQLIKAIPPQLLDEQGRINQKYYRDYLNRMHMSITEYEDSRADDIKRKLVQRFIRDASYVPREALMVSLNKTSQRKSFSILELEFEEFKKASKKNEIGNEELKAFFEKNRDLYRIPEKRSADYWTLTVKDYASKIHVDDQAVESFYQKNRSSLFRIAPEISIRKILIKVSKDALVGEFNKAIVKTRELYKELKEAPNKFAEFAKKHSDDTKTASKGGVIEHFKRGTYDSQLEKVAFKLQTEGELAEPIQTEEGVVLIQLVNRRPAKYKPLEQIRGKIVETIQNRRGLNNLRSDLESVMFHVKQDKEALNKFIKKYNFKTENTGLTGQDAIKGKDLKSLLSRKIFDKKESSSNIGYFEFNGSYVLYKEVGREKSFIPRFDKIRNQVMDDYYAGEAKKQIKIAVRKAKADLLANKKSLDDLKQDLNAKFYKTKLLKSEEVVTGIKNSESLVQKAFNLVVPSQVLKHRLDGNYYLVQVENIEQLPDSEILSKKEEIFSSEKQASSSFYLEAFIASLTRVARIEQYDDLKKNIREIG